MQKQRQCVSKYWFKRVQQTLSSNPLPYSHLLMEMYINNNIYIYTYIIYTFIAKKYYTYMPPPKKNYGSNQHNGIYSVSCTFGGAPNIDINTVCSKTEKLNPYEESLPGCLWMSLEYLHICNIWLTQTNIIQLEMRFYLICIFKKYISNHNSFYIWTCN